MSDRPADAELVRIQLDGVDAPQVGVPPGWQLLTLDGVTDQKNLTRFFDGREPRWAEIASAHLGLREKVARVLSRIESRIDEGRCGVELVRGRAGEGVTTALLQIAARLLHAKAVPTVLWRRDTTAPIGINHVEHLASTLGTLVLMSNDGETLVKPTHSILRQQAEFLEDNGIQIVIGGRNTELVRLRSKTKQWPRMVDDMEETDISGLELADAGAIVSRWPELDKDSPIKDELSDLDGLGARLAEAADPGGTSAGTKTRKALLGALLDVRLGPEKLKARVATLLDHLGNEEIGTGWSLADIIVVLAYAEMAGVTSGVPTSILSAMSSVDESSFRSVIEEPLGDEALAGSGPGKLRCRHPQIARVAAELAFETGLDVQGVLARLVEESADAIAIGEGGSEEAMLVGIGRRLVQRMPSSIPKLAQEEMTVGLARRWKALQPNRLDSLTGLSSTLVDWHRASEALEVWMPSLAQLSDSDNWDDWETRIRGAWLDLGIVMGSQDPPMHSESAWAAGVGLSDRCHGGLLDARTVAMSLAGLGRALSQMYADKPDERVGVGIEALHRLADSIYRSVARQHRGLDAAGYLQRSLDMIKKKGYVSGEPLSPSASIPAIRDALSVAADCCSSSIYMDYADERDREFSDLGKALKRRCRKVGLPFD